MVLVEVAAAVAPVVRRLRRSLSNTIDKPLPLEQTKRVQAMANQLGHVKDATCEGRGIFWMLGHSENGRLSCKPLTSSDPGSLLAFPSQKKRREQ